MTTVGIAAHPSKPISAAVASVMHWCAVHGVRTVGLRTSAGQLPENLELLDEDGFRNSVDAIVSLGGDGTMLGAMRLVADRPVPVLGTNYGNLGFLIELQPDELDGALARIVDGDFSIEGHHALDVAVKEPDGTEKHHLVFNDFVLARRPGQGTVQADMSVAGIPYGFVKADGIITAPPAGSTAYSYAAGGPVVSPALPAVVVTPVAPMAGLSRPFVLGHEDGLSLTLTAPHSTVALEADGVLVDSAGPGTTVTLRLRPDAGKVVRLDKQGHTQRGMLKLSLLDLPFTREQIAERLGR